MKYRVDITPTARRQLADLPRSVRRRIDEKILALAANPRPRGSVKLAGSEDVYRVRVGDYRILYTIRDEVLLVVVVKIGHRRDVYR
jgi:mRNA interferase RelE/StbE